MIYLQNIKAYICDELVPDIEQDQLPVDTDLLATGIIDSLSLVRLVVWIEEEFDISMGDIEIAPQDFRTVEKVSAFIERHSVNINNREMNSNSALQLQP